MSTTLRGMTWSHPRGYDPMVHCSGIFRDRTGIDIIWDKRSLQDFESFPVEDLARNYDLIVIDHPHVGQITAEGCLLPLDIAGREAERAALERGSVGPSYRSYHWQGRQWAFPIDAATQVLAWRADLLPAAPATWAGVLDLARKGGVALPLRSPHTLMVFMTLAANIGHPCAAQRGRFIEPAAGRHVYRLMQELLAHLDPVCLDEDPIQAFERMAAQDGQIACIPCAYGYVSYAIDGFRPNRLSFGNIPSSGELGPVGGTLGGTGIAVSARSKNPGAAIDFAYWIASEEVQSGPYARSGGQPGHAAAWQSDAVNQPVGDFYRATRATLEGSYLRPRHDGYMAFQQAASDRILSALRSGEPADDLLAGLESLFAQSLQPA